MCKTKRHAQNKNSSIIVLNPILFDCCSGYGDQCCSILTVSYPAIEIDDDFWLILLHMFCLDVYHNSFHLFGQNRMNIVLHFYSLLVVTVD
jgi:hypothetical protein